MTRSALSPRVSVALDFDPAEMRTKQAMRDECDVNNIMRKYIKTGTVAHYNTHGGEYMAVAPLDFHAAMNRVAETQQLFAGLPAAIRKRFANDPANFLAFVQDPANTQEAIRLGLAVARPGIDPETGEVLAEDPPPCRTLLARSA